MSVSSSVFGSTIVSAVQSDPIPQTPSELYLDLMKKLLTRVLFARGIERHTIYARGAKSRLLSGLNHFASRVNLEFVRLVPTSAADYIESGGAAERRVEDAETMLGIRQLDQMQRCIVDVLENNIPGDILEAGVWRGGMTIFMRAVLKAYRNVERKVWVVDSFEGFPAIDRKHDTFDWSEGHFAVSLANVQSHFARYGLLDDQVCFLKGFFSDTLPDPRIGKLSILRVDADLYTSTMEVLSALYPSLSVGGYAVFDDYQNLPDCRRAIDEYRQANGIIEEIVPIDQRAVFWKKLA
jgi:O-methyltransferase